MTRPQVSVVVPFLGDATAAAATLARLARLDLGAGDELIVADNTHRGAMLQEAARRDAPLAGGGFPEPVVVHANRERSSYHARNAGAARARGEWLLFCDADCTPVPGLLDTYFSIPPEAPVGALAGEIVGDPGQAALSARYARSRNLFSQTGGLYGHERAVAASGNLLVRRRTFIALGGFAEGIRSAGDIDLCLRLREAGWRLGFRPGALVHHRHRETLRSLFGAFARYAAGSHWLNDRHPGLAGPWPLAPGLAGSARDIARNVRLGDTEEALFRAIDAVGLVAHVAGYRRSNLIEDSP